MQLCYSENAVNYLKILSYSKGEGLHHMLIQVRKAMSDPQPQYKNIIHVLEFSDGVTIGWLGYNMCDAIFSGFFFYRKQEKRLRNIYRPTTAYSNHINVVLICRTFTYQKVYDQEQNVDVKVQMQSYSIDRMQLQDLVQMRL